MSKTGCYCESEEPTGENPCEDRFGVMDDLNRQFSKQIETIEKTGYTELLVAHLKKWIDALVTHDKVLIGTIESLECEALKRSEKITQLCRERLEVEESFQKYKKELCEKTELIKELNCKLKNQAENINQKECVIKRLNGDLDQLRACIDSVKNKNDTIIQDKALSAMSCQLESMKKELSDKECKIKSFETELCRCKKKLEEMQNLDDSQICKMEKRIERRFSQLTFKSAHSEYESDQVKDLIYILNDLESKINIKDEKLLEQSSKIQLMQQELDSKLKELEMYRINGMPHIEDMIKQEDYNGIKQKYTECQKEIEKLKKLLNETKASGESDREIHKKNIENMKRESRDMKEALTTEVAEKHDIITALRRDTAQLEEKARQADMQAIFKDDIIKELRKEVKLARAKESFVEMLGLNESSRVQMKSKIDSLAAELEDKQTEIISLESKLEEMNRHALEGKLGEMSLQLMDRERDMIILCNKVDYIKRYLDKLHEDEDVSIKCGLKALLLELNEETEWRRKARRSVTSLGDQPESVIIINRSNSLPAEPSEHVRYNGRVNELELKLERAREEICCLRKKLDVKESELTCLKEKNFETEDTNQMVKVLMPDSMLSLKLEEFQRFTDESGKKLQETVDEIKQHTINLLLKEEMEEFKKFLTTEQEVFIKASRQLHELLCNMKKNQLTGASPPDYKLQNLETKLVGAMEIIEKGRTFDQAKCFERDSSGKLLENMMCKVKESLMIVWELKQDTIKLSESGNPMSSSSNTKLIQDIQDMIKAIQNQNNIQQSTLFSSLDNQKEDTNCLNKKFSDVSCLLSSHCKSINYVKDEFKIALCNITKKTVKVKNQVDHITQFECSIKDVTNWINQNLKENCEIVTKVNNLQKNLQQIMCMKNNLDDSLKEYQNKNEENCADINDFDDKCIIARELCDEVNIELNKTACRINEREQKLTQLSKDICCFGDKISRIQEDIGRTAHLLSNDHADCYDDFSYEDAAGVLQDTNKQLLQALHNIKHKLNIHLREADSYDIKGIESRKIIVAKLKEFEEVLQDLSDILGEIKECEYIQSRRALSSESLKCAIRDASVDSANSQCNQVISPELLIQEMRNEISTLKSQICTLEKQNACHQKTIESLKYQIVKTKEEAEISAQKMVSSLQEKCQHDEPVLDKCTLNKLCAENHKLKQESTELRAMLQCKIDKINMMKREYVQLTEEVNQLTVIVQQEKECSKQRECSLQQHNTELYDQVQWLNQRLQNVCHSMSSAQNVDESSQITCLLQGQDESKMKLQYIQEKYSCLLKQYRELNIKHSNMQRAIRCSLAEKISGQIGKESNILREGTGYLTEDDTAENHSVGLCELTKLRNEIAQLNCENEKLNKENGQLIRERQHLKQEYDTLINERHSLQNEQDQCTIELQQALCQLQGSEKIVLTLQGENDCLGRNNELLSLENSEVKVELESVIEKKRVLEEKLKTLLEKYECLRAENDKNQKERIKIQKEMSELCDKTKLLRDEDCRESIALKQKYEDLKQELKCAQFKIEELEGEISKVEKQNLETAMLEADTQLLITKTDQEWNEMYVKKCTEVMELTEEIECLRKKIMDITGQMSERNELSNESKRVIGVLKKTVHDYKVQIVCLKTKLEKCMNCNRDMKREVDALEKSNRSMKQFIVYLNKEKNELLEKIDKLQSEGSFDYDDSLC